MTNTALEKILSTIPDSSQKEILLFLQNLGVTTKYQQIDHLILSLSEWINRLYEHPCYQTDSLFQDITKPVLQLKSALEQVKSEIPLTHIPYSVHNASYGRFTSEPYIATMVQKPTDPINAAVWQGMNLLRIFLLYQIVQEHHLKVTLLGVASALRLAIKKVDPELEEFFTCISRTTSVSKWPEVVQKLKPSADKKGHLFALLSAIMPLFISLPVAPHFSAPHPGESQKISGLNRLSVDSDSKPDYLPPFQVISMTEESEDEDPLRAPLLFLTESPVVSDSEMDRDLTELDLYRSRNWWQQSQMIHPLHPSVFNGYERVLLQQHLLQAFGQPASEQSAALLVLIWVTGQKAENLLQWRLGEEHDLTVTGQWHRTAALPPDRFIPEPSLAQPVSTERWTLTLPPIAQQALERLNLKENHSILSSLGQSETDLVNRLHALLQPIRHQIAPKRILLSRLAAQLRYWVRIQTQEPLLVYLIGGETGDAPPIEAYYQGYTTDQLNETYQRALQAVWPYLP